MASDNVDVSALLRQLEELKQKKARNIKKLKRKLGRAVVLKQPCTDDESSKSDTNDNDKSFPCSKPDVSQVRKVFGELNCKDQFSNSIKLPGSEAEHFKDSTTFLKKTEGYYEISSDCSKLSSTRLEYPGSNSELAHKTIANEFQNNDQINSHLSCKKIPSGSSELNKLAGEGISDSEFRRDNETGSNFNCKIYPSENSEHDQLVGRKRSVTELQNDDQTLSHIKINKKTKLADKEFAKISKQQVTNLEAAVCVVTKNESEVLTKAEHSTFGNGEGKDNYIDNNSSSKAKLTNIALPVNFDGLSNEEKIKHGNIMNNVYTTDNFGKNVRLIVPGKTDSNKILHADKESNLLRNSINRTEGQKISIDIIEVENKFNCCSNNYPDEVGKNKTDFSQNRLAEKYADEENHLSKILTKETESRQISFENDGKDNGLKSTQYDSNVIEVADTETLMVQHSQRNVIDFNNKCSSVAITNDVTNEQKIKSSSNEQLHSCCVVNEIAETEEIVHKDFPTDVAGFEEVITEVPPSVDLDGCLSQQVRHPSINCTFTDEEDETAEFENVDVDKLFMEESEDEVKEENLSQLADSEVSSPHLKQKQSNVVNNVFKESETLMIPETELFDFASYSNHEVDDIAQNVCIETDHADNTDEKKTAGNCHNTCTLTDEDPGIFIAKVEESCNNACINTDNVINYNNESICNIYKVQEDDKNIEIRIDHNKESDCNNFEMMSTEVENCNEMSQYEAGIMPANVCATLEEEKDSNEFGTDSLGTEDFLKCIDLQQMPFSSDSSKSNGQSEDKAADSMDSNFKFQCCFQSNIIEEVTQLKLCYFNNSYYLFIQHRTWVQVWRQETQCDWMKIFAQQVDDLQLKEFCLSQSESYLVLIMLLYSKQNQQCLQFLVFEKESRLIKLMEHTHWFENSENEDIFLCGLDDLRFASAQGRDDAFKVYSHSFSCLDDNPKLLTIALGSATNPLNSLCRIDKLPNALLGVSNTMLYVWHLLEGRLVTSVQLQTEDLVTIENCVWTTVESGLVFLLAAHRKEESGKACQLLATNLATGFCEVVLTYTLQPTKEICSLSDRKMNLVYCEPFIAAASDDGAFIWSIDDEYCCASLISSDCSSIAMVPTQDNSFLVVVGCRSGCANCYEIKCK